MSKTLLLADDSVTIQKVVGISFANEDIVLVTVDNGDDAVTRARETRPDIVLADVVMPGKSGYEVCEAIKADPELAHVPVLLLTGTFEAFDETRAAAAGADGNITKPFEAQALVDTVNARLAAGPVTPPAPTEPTPDDPFDFVANDSTAPSGLEADEAARTTMIMANDDLASSDAAFSFDAHDAASPEPAGLAPAGSDGTGGADRPEGPAEALTQVVMTTDELANADTLPPIDPADPLDPPAIPDAAAAPDQDVTRLVIGDPEPSLETEESDFGAPLDLDPAEHGAPAEATPFAATSDPLADAGNGESVFDPGAARDYDVSASDLATPVAPSQPLADDASEPAIAPPVREIAEDATPEPAIDADPDFAMVAPADAAADPVEAQDPGPFAEPVAAETALGDEPVFSAPDDPFRTDPAPSVATALPVANDDAIAVAPAAVRTEDPGLSPLMQQQLHDALEKVAWEAFGDVAERIVQDALGRIEEVAWEVIPKMAESLIQEEIRKLKGEDS